MKNRQFYTPLLLLTAAVSLAVLGMHQLPQMQGHYKLSIIGIVSFFLLSVLMFMIAKKAQENNDPNAFLGLVMKVTFGKMFLIMAIIVVYNTIFRPESKYFVLPFIVIYISYTVFETWFMMDLGKGKKDEL